MNTAVQATPWYVYIIQTCCGKLYTGITIDVQRRFQEHRDVFSGVSTKGAKFFRGHEPKSLVLVESFASRSEASKRELQIKAMSRQAKERLLVGANSGINYSSEKIQV
jgi:putative endonuclease